MLKIRDLSIDNYLWYENTIHKIISIDSNTDTVGSWWVNKGKVNIESNPYYDFVKNYKPIILDELWIIEKFRFIKIDDVTYKRGINDYNYVLTRDWREEPSYHFGIEYTDSHRECDDLEIYNFTHEVKHVHRLQNLFYNLEQFDIEENNE